MCLNDRDGLRYGLAKEQCLPPADCNCKGVLIHVNEHLFMIVRFLLFKKEGSFNFLGDDENYTFLEPSECNE